MGTQRILSRIARDLQDGRAALFVLGESSDTKPSLALDSEDARKRYLSTVIPYIRAAHRDNGRAEWLIIGILLALFMIAAALVVWANIRSSDWSTSGLVVPGLGVSAAWPIKKLLEIRRQNIALAVAPVFIQDLPPESAGQLIMEILGLPKGTKP